SPSTEHASTCSLVLCKPSHCHQHRLHHVHHRRTEGPCRSRQGLQAGPPATRQSWLCGGPRDRHRHPELGEDYLFRAHRKSYASILAQ
ncbi:hypothetical protein K523DRAFT_416667, partial [Schizophyllum commune Tattone D]